MQRYEQGRDNSKLILNLRNLSHVQIDKVIMIRGYVNYTKFYLSDGKEKLVSRTLKFYELYLQTFGFIRVHRSFMINPSYVQDYNPECGILTMEHGHNVTISRRRKRELKGQNF